MIVDLIMIDMQIRNYNKITAENSVMQYMFKMYFFCKSLETRIV